MAYRILVDGLAPGADPSASASKLKALLKTTDDAMERIVSSRRFIVKSDVDLQMAALYENAIRETGFICIVEMMPSLKPDLAFDIPGNSIEPTPAATTAVGEENVESLQPSGHVQERIARAQRAHAVSVASTVCVAVAIFCGILMWMRVIPNPIARFASANLLEKALEVGVGTRADMDALKDSGGIDNNHKWHGFWAMQYEAALNPSGKVGYASVKLMKMTTLGYENASLSNVRDALGKRCGSNWTRNGPGNGFSATGPTGTQCIVLDGDGAVIVTLANDRSDTGVAGSASPRSTPAAPPAVAPPAVVAAPPAPAPSTAPAAPSASVRKSVGMLEVGESYLVSGETFQKTVSGESQVWFKFDAPQSVVNKLDVNGKLMPDVHDGEVVKELQIWRGGQLEEISQVPTGLKGEREISIACSRADCSIDFFKY